MTKRRPPANVRRPSLFTVFGIGTTIVVAALVSALILGFAAGLAALSSDNSFGYYSTDPAGTLDASPFVGVASHAGVLLTFGAGFVCVFCGVLVVRVRGYRAAQPLLVLGVAAGYLAVDDLFLLHEEVYPRVLVEQETVLVMYGVAGVALLWWYRRFLRENEWPLLAVAIASLGVSYVLDLEEDILGWREENAGVLGGLWLENAPKLIGLVYLAAYLIRLSARTVIDAYPLHRPPERATAAAQSSPDPESAVATPRPM